MKLKYVLLSITGLISLGCSQNDTTPEPEAGRKELTVKLEGLSESRATHGAIIGKDTKYLEKLVLIVEGTSGEVIATREVQRWTDAEKHTETDDWKELTYGHKNGIRIAPLTGSPKTVHAFGNDVTVSTVGNSLSYTAILEEQTAEKVMYYGLDTALDQVTVGTEGEFTREYMAEISCYPLLSRIQVTSVTFKTTGSATITTQEGKTGTIKWSGFDGDLMGVYFNHFYTDYTDGVASGMLKNDLNDETITEGKWIFREGQNNNIDATAYASYCDYRSQQYNPLRLLAGQCYGFNFFVGTELPLIHFDLRNLAVQFDEYDEEVFDPSLFPTTGFASIVKYYNETGDEISEFQPGTLYNLTAEIEPQFVSGDPTRTVIDNLIIKVSIQEWAEEKLRPGFGEQ